MLSLQSMAIPLAASGTAVVYLVYRFCAHRARRARRDHLYSEVCREHAALCSVLEALPEQLESAKRSRIAALRTRGPSKLESTRQWLGELEQDLAEVTSLGSQLPAAETDDNDRSGMEL